MTASFSGCVDIVKILMDAKANLNTQDKVNHSSRKILYYVLSLSHQQNGWAALHLAAQEGRADVVRLLAEAGANINFQTKVYIAIYTTFVS